MHAYHLGKLKDVHALIWLVGVSDVEVELVAAIFGVLGGLVQERTWEGSPSVLPVVLSLGGKCQVFLDVGLIREGGVVEIVGAPEILVHS